MSRNDWKTYPMELPRTRHWARRESRLTQTSSSQISPSSSGSRSPIRLSSVDLPEPEDPATATNSPAFTSTSRRSSTGTAWPSGPRNVLLTPRARSIGSASAADGLGGREPRDPQGRVGRGERTQHDREAKGEAQQAGREEEELLPFAEHARVHQLAHHDREADPEDPARDRHHQRLAEDLPEELQVGGAQRALDAEIADALEDRGGHRVGERQPADHETEHADAKEQGREERGRLPQNPAQLTRDRDVQARDLGLDAPRERVRIHPVGPRHRGTGVEVGAAQPLRPAREHLHEQRVATEPQVARVVQRQDDEAVGRGQGLVEHPDDLERAAAQLDATPRTQAARG